MTGVGGPKHLGGSATAGIRAFVAKMTAVVDAKLICKHKGLIPDSNVKACQPI